MYVCMYVCMYVSNPGVEICSRGSIESTKNRLILIWSKNVSFPLNISRSALKNRRTDLLEILRATASGSLDRVQRCRYVCMFELPVCMFEALKHVKMYVWLTHLGK